MSVYFVAIWYVCGHLVRLWCFGTFVVFWYYFFLNWYVVQKQSGNPDLEYLRNKVEKDRCSQHGADQPTTTTTTVKMSFMHRCDLKLEPNPRLPNLQLQCQLRTVFNNMGLPLGGTWPPKSEFYFLGGMFTPSFTPRGEHFSMFIITERGTEGLQPQGITLPLGDKDHLSRNFFGYKYFYFVLFIFERRTLDISCLRIINQWVVKSYGLN
jgi:hypothetical protein